ncbi:uncharacterized protein LOC131056028 [Cryptomeria japonica]|uniref:uncharacterized protein LOC131056028 n=1 Tax=Cryptomeria japonica TaxID=3369 RepID=UPI0027DAAADC|nr:uncharacterized protein LOC131056028 [Cryptomeria japonica]
MVEALGRSITKARIERIIKGIKITGNLDALTHQQFANDTMLLGTVDEAEALAFNNILNLYARMSGQEINYGKSEIFFFNTPRGIETEISRMLGIPKGKLPCKYLRIEIDKGKNKKLIWKKTIEKISQRLNTWKNKWLSAVGRVTLIKVVLLAIPIYQMSCL